MISNRWPSPDQLIEQYLAEVESDRSRIGKWELAAVDRYYRDLEEAPGRGWKFDKVLARYHVNFFPDMLTHRVGEWAGQPFVLSPYQAFFCWNIYGWVDAETEYRRFRKALLYIARKGGKSSFCSGLLAKGLSWDEPAEPGGELYAAATKLEQSARLWHGCKAMIEACEGLGDTVHITGRANQQKAGVITATEGPNLGSYLKALGQDGKTEDGLNIQLVIRDEFHEWTDKQHGELRDKIATGMGARRQPLDVIATTAGSEDSEMLNEELAYAQMVLQAAVDGEPIDDSYFAHIFAIDEKDAAGEPIDFLEPQYWRMSNPMLGSTPKLKFLEDLANEAKRKPSSKLLFKRYHANQVTSTFEQAFPKVIWDRGAQEFPEPEDYALAFAGVDMAATNDWCAVVACFPSRHAGTWRYKFRGRFFCCDGVQGQIDYGREPFASWIAEGLLTYNRGEKIERAPIKAHLRSLHDNYQLQKVAYDRTYFIGEAAELEEDGLEMEDFPQRYNHYEPAVYGLLEAFGDGEEVASVIDHGSNPVLNWQAKNAQFVANNKGQRLVKKGAGKSARKVDGVVAFIMAFALAAEGDKNAHDEDVLIC